MFKTSFSRTSSRLEVTKEANEGEVPLKETNPKLGLCGLQFCFFIAIFLSIIIISRNRISTFIHVFIFVFLIMAEDEEKLVESRKQFPVSSVIFSDNSKFNNNISKVIIIIIIIITK